MRVSARRAFALLVCFVSVAAHAEEVETVTLCDIAADPARYNHHLVQVSGVFFHGFEGFTIDDPSCPSDHVRFWLEYGGSLGSETVLAGFPSSERHRDERLVVEDIPTTLVQDAPFRRFDRIVHQRRNHSGNVTLIARYFAGDRQQFASGDQWGGYGHLFGFSLLVVQQVLAVEGRD